MASQLRLLALLYNVVIAACGVALAYLCTSVHRAPLPRDEIAALPTFAQHPSGRPVLWPQVQIEVSMAKETDFSPAVIHIFFTVLSESLRGRARLKIRADNSIHTGTPMPCLTADVETCLESLEMQPSRRSPGLDSTFELILISSKRGSSVILDVGKRAFVRWEQQAISMKQLVRSLSQHLEASWLRPEALNEGVALFEITPGYVFSFFLVGDCQNRVSWDFEALSPFLSRFLERLQLIFDIELNSQVIQCGSLGTPLEPAERAHRTVDANMLQADFMRMTGEWPADTLPRDARWLPPLVRLVAFKPSTAVKLADERGQVQHSFALQGFGAVAIAACGNQTGSESFHHSLTSCEAETVTSGWISSLRSWLSLPANESVAKGAPQVDADRSGLALLAARPRLDGISDWEFEILARAVHAQFLRRTVETLRSLVELVDSLPDVEVRQEIASMAFKATQKTKASIEAAEKGDLLPALLESRQALVLALTVIHDDSVVSQLYFSWEFKYAVYLPISMPILVPVLTSTWRFMQSWMNCRKRAKR